MNETKEKPRKLVQEQKLGKVNRENMSLEEELDKRIKANQPRLNYYQFIHELRLLTERCPSEWQEFKKRHKVKP